MRVYSSSSLEQYDADLLHELYRRIVFSEDSAMYRKTSIYRYLTLSVTIDVPLQCHRRLSQVKIQMDQRHMLVTMVLIYGEMMAT